MIPKKNNSLFLIGAKINSEIIKTKYKWQKKHEDHIKLYTIELFHKLFLADL